MNSAANGDTSTNHTASNTNMSKMALLYLVLSMMMAVASSNNSTNSTDGSSVVITNVGNCSTFCHSDKFCGSDGACHRFNCAEWFRFGPKEFTGIEAASEAFPLACEPYAVLDEIERAAVRYGCEPSLNEPIESGSSMSFNERCSAKVGDSAIFECLQVNALTFFVDFVKEVEENPVSCGRQEVDLTPVFYYPVFFGSTINSLKIDGTAVLKTRSFDLDLALNFTFRSMLKPNPLLAQEDGAGGRSGESGTQGGTDGTDGTDGADGTDGGDPSVTSTISIPETTEFDLSTGGSTSTNGKSTSDSHAHDHKPTETRKEHGADFDDLSKQIATDLDEPIDDSSTSARLRRELRWTRFAALSSLVCVLSFAL